MKTTEQVLNQIISFGDQHESIRLVLLNGSRVNPSIQSDDYSDYDVIFGVNSYKQFIDDQSWMAFFGDLLILQHNCCTEDSIEFPIFLMQFSDGLRIDASFYPVATIQNKLHDSLTKVVLDKDHRIKKLDEPSDFSYVTKQPTEHEYYETVNEFWWCIINVGKGIARKELCYAKYMYESIVRECFLKIVSWHIGHEHSWKINVGKYGRFIKKNVSEELWEKIEKTYNDYEDQKFWESLYVSGQIVMEIESVVSKELGYTKRKENGRKVLEYLKRIEERAAPKSV